jgi:multiple sugar transport system substrate-binding protein
VYSSLYDDPDLLKQFPYLPTLKASVNNASSRPKVVKYGDATSAIEEDAYAALTGAKTSDDALKDLQTKLTSIVSSK